MCSEAKSLKENMQDVDFKNIIFNAARDGKLRRLKMFLDQQNKTDIYQLVAAKTNGATPLVVACRNGHYDVAEYLLERCNANIEQTGSVVFDGETIESAPPLWCASAAGHLAVVKLLVRHEAAVNSTTRTNSTPLRAACFDGHFEIVRFLVENGADVEVANRHGHTCLMIACFKGHHRIAAYLLELNANVNRKSVKGNTALHDCAESGSLEILKMLIEHGAKMDVDSYGMTPLLAASVTGHTHIVEYLIKLPELVSRHERIDALELLGSTYIDRKRDMVGALELWRRAFDDRFDPRYKWIPKPVENKTVCAYEHTQEICDLEQLDELLANPDEMRMQALLIRERILGPAHPDTSYYIRYRGAVYADAGKFSRCISLWAYALDIQQSMLEPLNPMTQSSLFSFTELFCFMLEEQGRPLNHGCLVPPLDWRDVLSVFSKTIHELESGILLLQKMPKVDRDLTYLQRVLVIALHVTCILAKVLPGLSEKNQFEIRQEVHKLIKLGVKTRSGAGPLHLACTREAGIVVRYTVCEFPSIALVELLIEAGANVHDTDDQGNTPLHMAAGLRLYDPPIAQVLLKHGAHLDACNIERYTFKDILNLNNIQCMVDVAAHTKLTCLAARALQKSSTDLQDILAQLPETLRAFVTLH